MRIDSHNHFWEYDPVRDAWIDDTMSVIRRDFLPHHMEDLIHKSSIRGTIAVQADQSMEETKFLLSLAEKNPFIKGVVGWVDLKASDIHRLLEDLSTHKLLKGFRHILQSEPDEFFDDPSFLRGIGALKDCGFTYDILVYADQLPQAIKLVEKNPGQMFVLDHIAKPYIKEVRMEPWASGIRVLAGYPNVYCKISGLITEADHSNWTYDLIYPYLDVVFESFGVKRLMFGSDWPVCSLAGSYEQVVDLVENYLSNYSGEEKESVFGGNAIRFYQLGVKSV